ncbi:putative Uncharacterized lactate 2-monooxygenase PB1A11.03 [Glarea lozoyensis 74030]|uniref:Putative Uncharacterized lactate 2-monooxygenase PB1A11.03 n=1 Tax=Glarea lozoyensis (strain ATCC 74030 / MF5533) TaxID=1104152 RepID=H0EY33_GLAL7|nr:putative Uncharacterized lactate 2-monooxygenase PB1A11.03 [Glarea lozoyensis 74030]
MDPHNNIIDYRRRFLSNLQPHWRVTDPNAKPSGWKDRCVSGTSWENPHPWALRVHNWSMNYRFASIYDCGSRLHNESTENMSCEVRVACGCTIVAPFSLIFEAITSVHGSSLGGSSAEIIEGRIISKDGLGLVQVGDIGRSFSLVAFGGDPYSHTSYASACRGTKQDRIVEPKMPWPRGRALVRDEFTHGMTDSLRDYGYVQTGGSGNLLERPAIGIVNVNNCVRAEYKLSIWYYASSNAGQSHTHLANRQSFYRHRIIPRMLVDTNIRDTKTTIFGHKVSAPIGFAPIGINKIYNPLGELPVAKVAKELNLPYCLSTAGSTPIEDVGKANGEGPRFFQLSHGATTTSPARTTHSTTASAPTSGSPTRSSKKD